MPRVLQILQHALFITSTALLERIRRKYSHLVFCFFKPCDRIIPKKEGKVMDTCVIFCAGEFDRLIQPIRRTDLVIAADGGLRHLTQLGIQPDIILGDFDSLGYTPEGAQVYPVEKDDTDSMLALRHGLRRGCTRFVLYGSLDGPRLDHTIANLQSLLFLAEHGAEGFLAGNRYIATVIKDSSVSFPDTATGILSVFCINGTADGVRLSGLKYPLENGQLSSCFPLGVSNHFTGQAATVSVKNGSLLLLYDRCNGLVQKEADHADL